MKVHQQNKTILYILQIYNNQIKQNQEDRMMQQNHNIQSANQQKERLPEQGNTKIQRKAQVDQPEAKYMKKEENNDKVGLQQQTGGEEEANEEVKFEQVAVEDDEEQQLLEESMEKAQQYKNKGGEFFKAGKQISAIQQYTQAMQYTADTNFRATLCSNIAICLLKDENYQEAKRYCLKALKYNENLRKARTNLARCLQAQQKYEQALEEYKKLENDAPANESAFIKDKVRKTQTKVDEINEKRKKEVMDGLKNIGNSVLGYFGMSIDNFKLEQGPGGGYNISFKQ